MALGLRAKIRHWLEARDAAKQQARGEAAAREVSEEQHEPRAPQGAGREPSESGGGPA